MVEKIYRCYGCDRELTGRKERKEGICKVCQQVAVPVEVESLHTWRVRPLNDVQPAVKVKAHRSEIHHGVLVFYKDNRIVRAFKEWREVELMGPTCEA